MAAIIEVRKIAEGEFHVRIIEGSSESSHHVTVSLKHFNRLSGGKIETQELVRRSFEFLLKREPKESILPRFDLQIIARYFPEYEREIKGKL